MAHLLGILLGMGEVLRLTFWGLVYLNFLSGKANYKENDNNNNKKGTRMSYSLVLHILLLFVGSLALIIFPDWKCSDDSGDSEGETTIN